MKLSQNARQEQTLHLSAAMQQSLKCLQLATPDLIEYLQEAALSNPLLDFSSPTPLLDSLPQQPPEQPTESDLPVFESELWRGGQGDNSAQGSPSRSDFTSSGTQTLADYLSEQLRQMYLPDEEMLSECLFLVACLDERGYLDCSLEDLAEETQHPLPRLEQALYAIQMLDPPGVGARDLSECLILQLMQGGSFDELTVHIVKYGLELLAKRDYPALARCFHASKKDVMRAAGIIFSLNPLPSRGFGSGAPLPFVCPDAQVRAAGGGLSVELNYRLRTRVSVNEAYAALLQEDLDADSAAYIRGNLAAARAILRDVKMRDDTLTRLICELVDYQRDYFLRGAPLRPLTMKELSQRLSLSPSTVSRAVQGKSLQFAHRVIPLSSLFSSAVSDESLSADSVRRMISALIDEEDADRPLTDDELCALLAQKGISVTRKTVSNYRRALHIPSSTYRKKHGAASSAHRGDPPG